MNLYPVNLDIHNQLCLVIGGGEVASRKICSLLDCGAKVVVISPEIQPSIQEYVGLEKITWHRRTYQKGDIEGAMLVFAATNNRKVQQQIADDARVNKVLANVVDDPRSGSFQVPARVRRGNFLLTVSTGGASPALAAKIRKDLEKTYGLEYRQFVELLSEIRQRVIVDGNTSDSHKVLFEKLLKQDILTQIQKRNWVALQEELGAILPENLNVIELIESLHQKFGEETE